MTCVKTGCALRTFAHVGHFWGDMHALPGGIFIFNSTVDRQGKALELLDEPTYELPTYFVHPDNFGGDECFYEKRGVFVFPVTRVGWNEALRKYLDLEGYGLGPLV